MGKSATAAKKATRKETLDDLTDAVVKGLQEKKARDIVILDLRAVKGAVTDFFVVCHGDSTTQVEALARSVEEIVEKDTGEKPVHVEGLKNAQWVLIDYINVVVHIFQPDQREFYGIERLWADAGIREIQSN